jgi:hypothetical protein
MFKLKSVIKFFLNDVGNLFSYILLFYLTAFLGSLFFSSWKAYFNWPAFHICVFSLFLLFIINNFHKTFTSFKFHKTNDNLIKNTSNFTTKTILKNSLTFIKIFFLRLLPRFCINSYKMFVKFIATVFAIDKTKQSSNIKIIIISIILALCFYIQATFFDFLILIFALRTILSTKNEKWSFILATILLIIIPISIAFDKKLFAEFLAIYAYYFLVIGVSTLFITLIKKKSFEK